MGQENGWYNTKILKAPGLVEFRAYPSTYPGQSTEQSNPALED